MRKLAAALGISLLTIGAAAAAPVKVVSTDKGDVLAGENGMALYTFRRDTPGVSNCYEQCATNWPPLFAEEGETADGDYTIVERNDGTKQWAKGGMPLYFWISDTKEGDTTGDGVGGNWDLARP